MLAIAFVAYWGRLSGIYRTALGFIDITDSIASTLLVFNMNEEMNITNKITRSKIKLYNINFDKEGILRASMSLRISTVVDISIGGSVLSGNVIGGVVSGCNVVVGAS